MYTDGPGGLGVAEGLVVRVTRVHGHLPDLGAGAGGHGVR